MITAVALVVRARSPKAGYEVVVEVDRSASAAANEVQIASVLERAVMGAAHLRSVRSESTANRVALTCSFDASGTSLDASARVKNALDAARAELPADAAPPRVSLVRRTQTFIVRATKPMADELVATPGVADVEVCSERGPEGLVVRIDLERMQARGADLLDIVRAPRPHGGSIEAVVVREKPIQVLLRDVAVASVVRRAPRCLVVEGDTPLVHLVRIDVEHGEAAVEKLRSAEKKPLAESEALVVRIAFPAGSKLEAEANALAAIVRELRTGSDVKGLTFETALLRDDYQGELVFASTRDATRADVDRLRDHVVRRPGMAWAGARGAAVRDVRQLVVTLSGDERAELETSAAEVRKRVAAVDGVLSLVRAPTGHVPEMRRAVRHANAAGLGVSAREVEEAVRIALGEDEVMKIDRSGPEALARVTIKGQPLSSLVDVTSELAPLVITHIDGRPAIELEWEVEDKRDIVHRVEKAIAPSPGARVTLAERGQ